MSLNVTTVEGAQPKTKTKSKNVFTDTAGIIAREGIHTATVVSTHHVGKKMTKYGTKDMQMFILHVTQHTDEGVRQTAEIHQLFHRSFSPQASLTAFLAGFGIKVQRGSTVDFDDLVGRKVSIIVTHSTDAHGVTHANVRVTPLRRMQ